MNGFDLTEISGSSLLTLMGGEFYAVNIQHLPVPTISLEKCCLEVGSAREASGEIDLFGKKQRRS